MVSKLCKPFVLILPTSLAANLLYLKKSHVSLVVFSVKKQKIKKRKTQIINKKKNISDQVILYFNFCGYAFLFYVDGQKKPAFKKIL